MPQGGTAKFSVIAVDADGNRKALPGALWTLVKIERNYQWYRNGSYWNYEPVTFTKAVANGTIDIAADSEVAISQPVDWGRYRLEIETADPAGPATSDEFDAGWYVAASSTETPDGLEIALDKENYAPGEVAKLQISPRFAGELLVTVGADRLLTTVSVDGAPKAARRSTSRSAPTGAPAPMSRRRSTGPARRPESRMPARAIGVKWLKVDPGEKQACRWHSSAPEKIDAARDAVRSRWR